MSVLLAPSAPNRRTTIAEGLSARGARVRTDFGQLGISGPPGAPEALMSCYEGGVEVGAAEPLRSLHVSPGGAWGRAGPLLTPPGREGRC